MSGVKLTKAQKALYGELPCGCSTSYAPAVRLVELGLARWERVDFGRGQLVPALAQSNQTQEQETGQNENV